MVSHWYGTSLLKFTSFYSVSPPIFHFCFLLAYFYFFFYYFIFCVCGYFSRKQNLKMISWLEGHPREQHRSTFVSEQDKFASQYYPKEREVKMQVVHCLFPELVCFSGCTKNGSNSASWFLYIANKGKPWQETAVSHLMLHLKWISSKASRYWGSANQQPRFFMLNSSSGAPH